MIIAIIVGMLIVVALLEWKLAKCSIKHLCYECSIDETLVEPEQKIHLTSSVSNYWKYPVLYAGMSESFQEDIELYREEKTRKNQIKKVFFGFATNYRFYLMPHTRFVSKVALSIPKRGEYELGNYYMEAGDFLGINSEIVKDTMGISVIVMPKRSDSQVALQSLGGFIGNISVRRFILEDPVLTIGFRDYTSSDPMKSISWKQTARTGKMQVKQYDYTVDASVAVLLNTENGTREDIENCLELTRTACEELEQKQIPFEFYTNGDITGPMGPLPWLAEGLGRTHLNQILYGLGKSNCFNIRPFENTVEHCIQRRKSNKSYILITPPLSERERFQVSRLQMYSDQEICVLVGKGEYQEKGVKEA